MRRLLPSLVLSFVACAPAETTPTQSSAPVAMSAAPLDPQPRPAAVPLGAARIAGDRLDLGRSPTFVTGTADLESGPENESYLATVVDYMGRNPSVTMLRIEAHTDAQGASAFVMKLSQDRAERIVAALVERGVAPGRVRAIGYGKTRPIAPNDTTEGRLANRRIELHVEEIAGTPIGNRTPPP